ncbi:tyrosine-protein phosphatase [Pedobacter sp. L105]|uniref:tyrosine-protein phosphatase n=1 Tax=Pedobacter sp. L105 TaxID=1641871 RepID=UPI00131B4F93|nr:CpsB/CapC family capsule biosynthesis tyrosine phosphatase [Pedobacter sp. L105]
MFSFFNKKNNISDIEWLGVDVHSHLLPGIDDGAQNMMQSLNYIHQLQELGFSRLICTPHIYSDVYPNTKETILPVLAEVRLGVKKAGWSIEIDAAAEYMADGSFTAVEDLLTLPQMHILIEMSYLSETPNIDEIIFDLQIRGYKVILAHPERYNYYHGNIQRYQRFKEIGCGLQLNLLAILGYYGKRVKVAAEEILKEKLYEFAGTDLHHEKHMINLTAAIRNGTLYKMLGKYEFRNNEVFSLPGKIVI